MVSVDVKKHVYLLTYLLTSPRIDKMVFCVVTDSCSESEDKAFLPAIASAVKLELTDVTKPNERIEDLLESKNHQFC